MKIRKTISKFSEISFIVFCTLAFFMSVLHVSAGFSYSSIFSSVFQKPSFQIGVYESYDSEYVNDIAEFCKGFDGKDQIKCVVSEVGHVFNYSDYDVKSENETIFRIGDDYIEKGGVCRDTTIMHAAILNQLNWSFDYVFDVPKHVFLTAHKGFDDTYYYCTVDQLSYTCEQY